MINILYTYRVKVQLVTPSGSILAAKNEENSPIVIHYPVHNLTSLFTTPHLCVRAVQYIIICIMYNTCFVLGLRVLPTKRDIG